jgi:hypothetical protein
MNDLLLLPLKIFLIALDVLVRLLLCCCLVDDSARGFVFPPFHTYTPQPLAPLFVETKIFSAGFATKKTYKQLSLLTFGWVGVLKKLFLPEPLRSVPVGDDESHRVDPRYRTKLAAQPREGVDTLYDLVKDAFARYGHVKCMGTREFLGWKVPGKVKHFGETIQWLTFEEVGLRAHKFGAACRSAGLQPAPYTTTLDAVKSPCRVAIFENTCRDWMIAAIGCFTQSIAVTTVYATLGMDAVVEAVVDNSIVLIVCNKSNVSKLLDKASKMPTLTHIVYTSDLVGPDDTTKLPAKQGKVKIVSFEEFCAGGDTKAYPPTPPKADTCAVVMYTSGSTGKPKGVVITHRQYVFIGSSSSSSSSSSLLGCALITSGRVACLSGKNLLSHASFFLTLSLDRINAVVAAAEVALTIQEGRDVYVRVFVSLPALGRRIGSPASFVFYRCDALTKTPSPFLFCFPRGH